MTEPRPCAACGAYHLHAVTPCPADLDEPHPICPHCLAYEDEPCATTCPLVDPDWQPEETP